MSEVNKDGAEASKKLGGMNILGVLYGFVKKLGTVAAVYMLGYYNLSVAWLITPVIFAVVREEWKKESESKRNIAKAAALSNEKDVILARIDDLPAWVFFPDVERVEWVNRILRQVWPNMNNWTKGLLKESIEPNVRTSLESYKMYGFRFDKMILGSIPLRIGGVKVYDRNIDRNEVIMDMDLFYAGDCDISFFLSGVRGGIKDFQIHGMMRVVMKPLISSMPLFGGLQLFFLNNPVIDFNLVGVADLLDMPGLSDLLRRVVVEQIANMMVLPNKLPIKLSDLVPARLLKIPEPEGVLRVHVVEAKHLMKKDISMLGKGKSDPYAVVSLGAQEFRTPIIDNNVNPKWDFWCESTVFEAQGQTLEVKLFDSDDVADDELLGRTTFDVSNVKKKGQVDLWVDLQEAKHGMLHVRMMWMELSKYSTDLKAAIAETQELRVTSMSTALLMVFVDSAKQLPEARPAKNPDPFVIVSVGKKEERTTMQFRNPNPVWEQGFTFLVGNPEHDTVHVKVVDQKTEKLLGLFSYPLTQLLNAPDMELESQPFRLAQSGPDTKIFLSLQLRIMKAGKTEGDSASLVATETDGAGVTVADKELEPLLPETGKTLPGTPGESTPTPVSKFLSKESLRQGSSTSLPSLPLAEESVSVGAPAPTAELSPLPAASELRNRTTSSTSSAGEAGLGRIQLTLRYSIQRQRLIIVIHKVANLPLKDPAYIPDPYVKLYLLPERSKESKRKTETVKDNCNPVYDQTLEYVMSQGELNSKQLEVSVVTRKGFFSSGSPIMGQVVLSLADYDLTKAITSWFDLQPEVARE
ncbi:extended synaptotagmin-2 isoform X2 [Bacillus rossius redtenbacheri]|uniref:extended synaptotagmin-2 isoform X2 n=1 Tax=Bacillus rossius redtenbacheri TaxID=93214 RepID=UPI002FDD210D